MNEVGHLILDTNVAQELLGGFHDLETVAEAHGEADASPVQFRARRARYSILLAWLCHERRWNTGVHVDELKRKLVAIVPPDSTGPVTSSAILMVHFIYDEVLRDWTYGNYTEWDPSLRGTRVDEDILSCAQRYRLPLITNEGLLETGVIRERSSSGGLNLRGKAVKLGVPVFTPEEFLRSELVDTDEASRAFMRRFQAVLPLARADWQVPLVQLMRIYDFVLFG